MSSVTDLTRTPAATAGPRLDPLADAGAFLQALTVTDSASVSSSCDRRPDGCGLSTRKGLLEPHRDQLLDQGCRQGLVDAEAQGPS